MWVLSFQGAEKTLISPSQFHQPTCCLSSEAGNLSRSLHVCTETRGITNTGMYKKRKQLMCFGGGVDRQGVFYRETGSYRSGQHTYKSSKCLTEEKYSSGQCNVSLCSLSTFGIADSLTDCLTLLVLETFDQSDRVALSQLVPKPKSSPSNLSAIISGYQRIQ